MKRVALKRPQNKQTRDRFIPEKFWPRPQRGVVRGGPSAAPQQPEVDHERDDWIADGWNISRSNLANIWRDVPIAGSPPWRTTIVDRGDEGFTYIVVTPGGRQHWAPRRYPDVETAKGAAFDRIKIMKKELAR
jgi:hypothetical protein